MESSFEKQRKNINDSKNNESKPLIERKLSFISNQLNRIDQGLNVLKHKVIAMANERKNRKNLGEMGKIIQMFL